MAQLKNNYGQLRPNFIYFWFSVNFHKFQKKSMTKNKANKS